MQTKKERGQLRLILMAMELRIIEIWIQMMMVLQTQSKKEAEILQETLMEMEHLTLEI